MISSSDLLLSSPRKDRNPSFLFVLHLVSTFAISQITRLSFSHTKAVESRAREQLRKIRAKSESMRFRLSLVPFSLASTRDGTDKQRLQALATKPIQNQSLDPSLLPERFTISASSSTSFPLESSLDRKEVGVTRYLPRTSQRLQCRPVRRDSERPPRRDKVESGCRSRIPVCGTNVQHYRSRK